ncbi:MAG: VTT domain-containing protein [Burkholderiaceae bacterium]
MNAWADGVIALIAANPHWASALVFIVAAAESIVLAGYVIPGTVILFGVGGIAAVGNLPLLPIIVWAAAGAIVGDGFSYWLGHRYRHSLRNRWPFTRYPGLIDRGEAFFHRYGAMSIAIGRFVPVLKPIIPVAAGIAGMPPARFYLVNILSALVWSPVHILPGVLAGASLHLLRGVSPRLAAAIVIALLLLVLLWLLLRLLILRTMPLLNRLLDRAYAWTQRVPGSRLQRLGARFDPSHPATTALLATYVLLLAALIGFLVVLANVLERETLLRADQALSTFIQGLRNPWTDPVMIAFTSLGDGVVTTAVAVSLIGWLAWQRRFQLAATVATAIVLTSLSVPLMKGLMQVQRPNDMYAGVDAFSFPSGHSTMTAAVYFIAGWLVAGGFPIVWRPLVYVASVIWVAMMALSRIYLGAHWPSDVLAGICLGVIAPAAVAALYHDFGRGALHPRLLALALTGVLATLGTWYVSANWPVSTGRYARVDVPLALHVQEWWRGEDDGPPRQRIELGGEFEEPFVLQWLGSEGRLRSLLTAQGWADPPPWTLATASGYLRPGTRIDELPVPPRLAEGRLPLFTLTRAGGDPDHRSILRAWPSGYTDMDGNRPLLLVSVVTQQASHPAQALTLTRTSDAGRPDARVLLPALTDANVRVAAATPGEPVEGPIRAMEIAAGPTSR